ncbi:MAG: hypothetical protein H6605_06160 [Flavobacteriales bacterium]|nr:hypothetical protein [Flavobacteriales bacterium]
MAKLTLKFFSFFSLLSVVCSIQGCITIENRRYTKGFFVQFDHSKKRSDENVKSNVSVHTSNNELSGSVICLGEKPGGETKPDTSVTEILQKKKFLIRDSFRLKDRKTTSILIAQKEFYSTEKKEVWNEKTIANQNSVFSTSFKDQPSKSLIRADDEEPPKASRIFINSMLVVLFTALGIVSLYVYLVTGFIFFTILSAIFLGIMLYFGEKALNDLKEIEHGAVFPILIKAIIYPSFVLAAITAFVDVINWILFL